MPNDPRPDIDDYTLTNLGLEKRNLVENLDISLHVRNLFDTSASEPSPLERVPGGSLIPGDFPLEERSLHFSATLHF